MTCAGHLLTTAALSLASFLLASSAASLAGPALLLALRQQAEGKALRDLLTTVDPDKFQATFGAPLDAAGDLAQVGGVRVHACVRASVCACVRACTHTTVPRSSLDTPTAMTTAVAVLSASLSVMDGLASCPVPFSERLHSY